MGEIFEVKLEKKKQWLKVIIFTGFTQRTCENVDISIYIEKLDISIYIEYILTALSRFAKYMFWI